MKQKKNDFLVDLMKILPEKIECLIQAPSLDNKIIQEMFQNSDYDYYELLELDDVRKKIFIDQALKTSFGVYIQKIEIKENGILLFEGFDGIEYGMISNKVSVPQWFIERYIPDICVISTKW